MRLDLVVHSLPRFYKWKIDAIGTGKRLLYRLLFIDKKIDELRRTIETRNALLLEKHVARKRVLEIGCGNGNLLGSLAKNKDCECVGVDLSREMIQSAEKQNPGPVYKVMDSSKLAFADKQFDVVLFNYVLHHVKDIEETIAEAKRVGGTVIFYECCAWKRQPFKTLSKLYWKVTDGGHQYLTIDEWKRRFNLTVLDEIEGSGLVRYGMCVLKA